MRAPYASEGVYFEDEMRLGTRTGLGRRWGPEGHRPQARVKIGYEFTHLFVAIAPATGRVFAMFLPALDQACFRLFGQEFEQELTSKVLLVADRATAHQQKLLNPERLVLEKLPAASPELNPVERFFQELRKKLAFRVYLSPSSWPRTWWRRSCATTWTIRRWYAPSPTTPISGIRHEKFNMV